MQPQYRKRAQIALGVAVIAVVFLAETVLAHRIQPNPASPWVWTVLGLTLVGALAYAVFCRLRAGRVPQDDHNRR